MRRDAKSLTELPTLTARPVPSTNYCHKSPELDAAGGVFVLTGTAPLFTAQALSTVTQGRSGKEGRS
jgi:hypothetical protein